MVVIYGVTWLAWGAVAESQIDAYSISLSFSVVLSLGTSLFTLLALSPQATASTKISLRSQSGLSTAITAFTSAVRSDSRYLILALCDMLKLVLSLALLASSEHISL